MERAAIPLPRLRGRTPITIRLGRPSVARYGWCCTFQIKGLGDAKVRGIYGVDAFQAIDLTVKIVNVLLATSTAGKAKQLHWPEGEKFDDAGSMTSMTSLTRAAMQ